MLTGTNVDGSLTCIGRYTDDHNIHTYIFYITLSSFNQISMSVHKILASVDLEPVIITMEDSMNVTVQVEQWPQDPILITVSRVLVCGVFSAVVLYS